MNAVICGSKFQVAAQNLHRSGTVQAVIGRIDVECSAVDGDVTAADIGGFRFVGVEANCLDSLCADIGFIGIAVHSAAAHAAAPWVAAVAAGSAAGEGVTRVCFNGNVSPVHGEGLFCLNAV